MKRILYCVFSFFLLANGMGWSQQMPMFSQYMMNKFLVNPAYAGQNGYTIFNLTARQQYPGFINAPRTIMFSAQTRILEDSYIFKLRKVQKKPERKSRSGNVGLGGMVYNDRNGIVSRTGLQLTYAYHLRLNNLTQLSFGISGSAYQYKLDAGDTEIYQENDPLLMSNRHAFFVPDANFGVYLYANKFYAGLSVMEVFGSNLKLGKEKFENYKTLRHINLTAGYKFSLSGSLVLEPSMLTKFTANTVQVDINTRLFYQRDYWLGISYRTNNTFVTMAGVSVDALYFGYAYDASLNEIRNYAGGAHELMVGIKLGETNVRRKRWVRPDISDIEE